MNGLLYARISRETARQAGRLLPSSPVVWGLKMYMDRFNMPGKRLFQAQDIPHVIEAVGLRYHPFGRFDCPSGEILAAMGPMG